MKISQLTIIFVITIIQFNCIHSDNSYLQNELRDDTLFIRKIEKSLDVKLPTLYEQYSIWSKSINRTSFHLYYVPSNRGSVYLLISKEILPKRINRNYCILDDYYSYNYLEYDSLEYDRDLLTYDYNDMDTVEQLNYSYIYKLSLQFWNINDIRIKDKLYQEKVSNLDDIKELEKLINELSIITFDEQLALRVIKLLYKKCIIKTINWDPRHYDKCGTLEYFEKYIGEIKTKQNINYFRQEILSDTIQIRLNNTLISKWNKDNCKFLSKKIEAIKDDLQNDNIYYFFTYPDNKLFKLTITKNDDKYILESEFINKEYMWLDAENGIPPFKAYF